MSCLGMTQTRNVRSWLWSALILSVLGTLVGAAIALSAVRNLSSQAERLAKFERTWSEATWVDQRVTEAADDFAQMGRPEDRERFVALNEPRFVVRDVVREGQNCWMTWDFIFRFKRWQSDLQTIRGATHFHWNEQGKIISHRDYWDAAEELYEKLPFIGILMRWLKRRANT